MQANELVANLITHDWSDAAQHATHYRSNSAGCMNFRAINRAIEDVWAKRKWEI